MFGSLLIVFTILTMGATEFVLTGEHELLSRVDTIVWNGEIRTHSHPLLFKIVDLSLSWLQTIRHFLIGGTFGSLLGSMVLMAKSVSFSFAGLPTFRFSVGVYGCFSLSSCGKSGQRTRQIWEVRWSRWNDRGFPFGCFFFRYCTVNVWNRETRVIKALPLAPLLFSRRVLSIPQTMSPLQKRMRRRLNFTDILVTSCFQNQLG